MSRHSTTATIRPLGTADIPALQALRLRALREHPVAFSSSPEDDRVADADFMARSLADTQASAVFGAFEQQDIVGMVGVVRERQAKLRHSALVWGMFVAPEARRRGLGRRLMECAIERARAWPGVVRVQLAVSTTAPEARALYESLGFRAWGVQPEAVAHAGALHDEVHMSLDLRSAAPAQRGAQ